MLIFAYMCISYYPVLDFLFKISDCTLSWPLIKSSKMLTGLQLTGSSLDLLYLGLHPNPPRTPPRTSCVMLISYHSPGPLGLKVTVISGAMYIIMQATCISFKVCFMITNLHDIIFKVYWNITMLIWRKICINLQKNFVICLYFPLCLILHDLL